MPPLFEGSSLYMPTALPGISISQATRCCKSRTASFAPFPKLKASSVRSAARTARPTTRPLDMYDTTVMLKPREQWRPGMTYEKLIQEMDEKLQFPGLSNTWTMPVENRLDMELTGIKTPLGIKIQGPNVDGIEQLGAQIQQVLAALPQVRSVFAERVSQGFYVNVDVNRAEAARYGLTVEDVQTRGHFGHRRGEHRRKHRRPRTLSRSTSATSGIFADNVEELRRVLVATPSGAQIPLGQVAHDFVFARPGDDPRRGRRTHGLCLHRPRTQKTMAASCKGEPALRAEAEAAAPVIPFNGPANMNLSCARKERLKLILPVVFFVIFLLLYLVFHSVAEALVLIFPDDLRDDRRTAAAVAARLQLQRGRVGRLYRAVWHCGRNRCRDGRLSA